MPTTYDGTLLDHLSNAQLFWFTLNTSYDHGCLHASRFRLDPEDYEVVLPLVATPSRLFVVPAGCCIASCCPLIAPLSCRLVVPAGCCVASCRLLVVPPSRPLTAPACSCITSPYPLVAPPSHPLITPAGCCVASQRAALLSSSCLIVPPSHSLVAPAGCRNISRRPLVAPPSCPLIMPAGCCVASSCTSLSSSIDNAIKHFQMLLSPSNATVTAAIERHLSCPPLPQLPSIATVKCQRPPSSVAAIKH